MSEEKIFLPKNFCQIGEKEDRVKIYLEDYVHAYLSRCRQSAGEIQTGVLLGFHEIREDVPCLFICGAVGTDRIVLNGGRLFFLEDAWEDIGRQMNEYFPDLGICGWYLHEKCGMSVDRLSLKKTYQEMFAQGDKALLLSGEDGGDFYILRNGNMLKMLGYYIYYERNDAMQAYMASHRRRPPVDEPSRPDAARAFREKLAGKEQEEEAEVRGPFQWVEAAVTTAAVLVLAWILGTGGGMWQKKSEGAVEAAATLEADYESLIAAEQTRTEAEETTSEEETSGGEAEE